MRRRRKGGWLAGKTFVKDGVTRHIIAVAHTDPGGLLFGLLMGEALIHIILPLVPFAFLITFFVSATVRRTLLPLQSLAEQAKRVQSMEDIHPLDPKDAPQEVAELVKTLNIALEKLRASIEAEKQFLQDAAHALRTPLAIVKARLELDGEKVDKNSMVEEVDGLIRLASQLLASANAERLVLPSDARANLADLARDVVSNMTPLAIRTGVDLGYSDAGGRATVRGDADAISHALEEPHRERAEIHAARQAGDCACRAQPARDFGDRRRPRHSCRRGRENLQPSLTRQVRRRQRRGPWPLHRSPDHDAHTLERPSLCAHRRPARRSS